MHGHDWGGSLPRGEYIKNGSEIRHSSQRFVFIDEGRLSPGSWTIYYDEEGRWDCVPIRHGMGSTFSFVDGVTCSDSAAIVVTKLALSDTTGVLLDVNAGEGLIVSLCKGDVVTDGVIDVKDVLQAVQFILEKTCVEAWSTECWAADYNDDGVIDATDLVDMINVILGN